VEEATFKEKNIFWEQGDIFSTGIKTENCPELTRSPQRCPQLTDGNSCAEAGWVPGPVSSAAEESAATSSKRLGA